MSRSRIAALIFALVLPTLLVYPAMVRDVAGERSADPRRDAWEEQCAGRQHDKLPKSDACTHGPDPAPPA